MNRKSISVYIHIPFCVDRCSYCDFTTVAYRMAGWRDNYIPVVLKEIRSYRKLLMGRQLDGIYFGGGTPSLVSPGAIAGVIDELLIPVVPVTSPEITLEATPNTLSPSRIQAYRRAGVNRFSMGVQSLDDRDLESLGRRHRSVHAHRTAAYLAEQGISWNLDLLLGVPGQASNAWDIAMDFIGRYRPGHVSVYLLERHMSTRLGRACSEGLVRMPEDTEVARSWMRAHEDLSESGYEHYEVSNYALRGCRSKHNLRYWRLGDYIGFGMAAHSCVGSKRWSNPNDWPSYRQAVHSGIHSCTIEIRDKRERMRERILLGLRTSKGVPTQWLLDYHKGSERIGRTVRLFTNEGWLRLRRGRIRVTPQGWLRLTSLYHEMGLA